MAAFKFLPFVAVLAVFVLLLTRKIKAPYGVKSGAYQTIRRLWWLSVALCVTSAYLFVYILLQPQRGQDVRWLAGISWFEAPRMAEMSRLEGPVISGLNPVIDGYNGMTGGVNFLGESIDSIENFRRAYGHTFMQSLPLLVYVAVAVVLLVLLSKSMTSLREGALKKAVTKVSTLEARVASLVRQSNESDTVLRTVIEQLSSQGVISIDVSPGFVKDTQARPQPVDKQGVLDRALMRAE